MRTRFFAKNEDSQPALPPSPAPPISPTEKIAREEIIRLNENAAEIKKLGQQVIPPKKD